MLAVPWEGVCEDNFSFERNPWITLICGKGVWGRSVVWPLVTEVPPKSPPDIRPSLLHPRSCRCT